MRLRPVGNKLLRGHDGQTVLGDLSHGLVLVVLVMQHFDPRTDWDHQWLGIRVVHEWYWRWAHGGRSGRYCCVSLVLSHPRHT